MFLLLSAASPVNCTRYAQRVAYASQLQYTFIYTVSLSQSQVVRGAGLMYADAIMHIPRLGAGGAAQLAADAEYFSNVMSALAVAPPPVLITVQVRSIASCVLQMCASPMLLCHTG